MVSILTLQALVEYRSPLPPHVFICFLFSLFFRSFVSLPECGVWLPLHSERLCSKSVLRIIFISEDKMVFCGGEKGEEKKEKKGREKKKKEKRKENKEEVFSFSCSFW